jgi:hypothetical protein
MTGRDELLDALTAERFRPIPAHPAPLPPGTGRADTPGETAARRRAMCAEMAPKAAGGGGRATCGEAPPGATLGRTRGDGRSS